MSIIDEEDPFQDINIGLDLEGLISQTVGLTAIVVQRSTLMKTVTFQFVLSLMTTSGRRDFYTA